MLPGGAWREPDTERERDCTSITVTGRGREKKKPTTPAPVYLKSIKGYHHKIFVFPLRANGTRASLSIFFPPFIHSGFAKAFLFASSQKKRKVDEEKEQKEHSLPRYGATAGDEVRNAPSCDHVRVMQYRSCEPSHPSH
jgi:hypothetical protein